MTPPAKRSIGNRAWQAFLKFSCRLGAICVFNVRCEGRDKVPATGGGLMLSNHQSNLDPVLVGLACNRRLNYVARKSLFKFAPFRWLINSLDAIPIDREGTGLEGLKETLKRLKRGEIVLLFPEGTRTPNGEVLRMKPGFCAVARRSGLPLFPVALDGAWQAWPRQRVLPGRSIVHIHFGEPIGPELITTLDDAQLTAEVERRIRECHRLAREGRMRAAPLLAFE